MRQIIICISIPSYEYDNMQGNNLHEEYNKYAFQKIFWYSKFVIDLKFKIKVEFSFRGSKQKML